MNRQKTDETMLWIPIYEQQEEGERPVVAAYECSRCWWKTRVRYTRCPHCKRKEYDPYEGFDIEE
jgi:lipopolysaccharide biosynthesis regulator YciM